MRALTITKVLLISAWLCFGAASAFAQNQGGNQGGNVQGQHRGAPAPLIGFGIPVAMAV